LFFSGQSKKKILKSLLGKLSPRKGCRFGKLPNGTTRPFRTGVAVLSTLIGHLEIVVSVIIKQPGKL
jgi:hypothetical protein